MVITILNFSDPSGARLRHLLAKSMSGSLRLEAVLGNHILTIVHRHIPQVAAGRNAGEVRPLVLCLHLNTGHSAEANLISA